ncbi:YciI family protein [Agrococcus carbonis]|uniref:Uncharacterized conserved protein n=1 Tax=Agrococcus carbonis TaxID=684552 RepID=A0A1H1PHD7_9MICO|nr:YciI family protein [Agrococcus carbonis]SDS10656.1 Uncharacterized conserved protein [Agrococcus carbonis]
MPLFMISFPSGEMQLDEGGLQAAADDAHAVVREAKAAGVWVFGGGIDESVRPTLVSADGREEEGTYPQTARLEGGYTIIDVPSRADAVHWAAKTAAACRCRQELRQFQDDPESLP